MLKRWGKDWSERSGLERIADAGRSRRERVSALLAARTKGHPASESLARPGIGVSTVTRYATTANPEGWAPLSAGAAAVDALLESVIDGRDRVLLGWPERPGNGFTLATLAMREARASGRLASATLGIWPWRPGLMRAARSALVHPGDIADAARRAFNEIEAGAAWTEGDLAQRSLCMIELRLKDLVLQNAPPRVARGRQRLDILVRSPSLVETTAVFPPDKDGFTSDAEQVLKRVRNHTHLGDKGAGLPNARADVGSPTVTPFALLGLPPERVPARLARLLGFERIAQHGLDAVVVDLTRQSRAELGDQWERSLSALLDALDTVPGRRPPVVAVCEDPFALRGASRTLRAHAARLRPRRAPPVESGIYLAEPGFFSRAVVLPERLSHVAFTADIKDASLVDIREKLVTLGRRLRDGSDGTGARGVSRALAFLRRVASLPLGLEEARRTADTLFDADDEVDAGIRAMFRPRMALGQLAEIGESSPEGAFARDAVGLIASRLEGWGAETPVSAKLADLIAQEGWNTPATLIAVPERRVAEVLIASDRGVSWRCGIVDHSGLASALAKGSLQRVIVTGPSATAIRALLTSPATPSEVVLLGDASGSALLAGELGPLARLPGFAPVAARASAMHAALKRGGLDERLDARESEFRILPIAQPRDIDLTREGGSYAGEKILLSTSAHRIAYRPSSDVLVFTSGEARPFEKVPAREVERGDQILVLDEDIRDRIRHALATSRTSLAQLADYHRHIARLRDALPGSVPEKARELLSRMREIDPALPESEVHNVQRWLTADLATPADDGARQPRAARDWPRFRLFMEANGVDEMLAQTYWRFAIVPTRSYRVQEGFQFNQRVVQFVLDPESFSAGQKDGTLRGLWLSLLDAVDDVENIETVTEGMPRE
ncbi:hypothetical protein [Neorhizobium petrolearium]|uniref:hypothetical protein n=1 Tax=Neorhizobium petrolearium TaxID=515361 RepID=UPI003F7E2D63